MHDEKRLGCFLGRSAALLVANLVDVRACPALAIDPFDLVDLNEEGMGPCPEAIAVVRSTTQSLAPCQQEQQLEPWRSRTGCRCFSSCQDPNGWTLTSATTRTERSKLAAK